MKMKKIFLLFSMITVFFSLTACSSGQEEVTFRYEDKKIINSAIYQAYQFQNVSDSYRAYLQDSEEERAEVLLAGISNFDSAAKDCGEFKGYRSKDDGSSIMFDFSMLYAQDADQEQLKELLNEFLDLVDAEIEEEGSNVIVTLTAVYDQRDVTYNFVFEENPAYAYAYDLYQQNVDPYQMKEVTVTPDYTFTEKMGTAGANTLMGMGTVFIVLIFISLIIGQFERLDKVITKVGIRFADRKSNLKDKRKANDAGVSGEITSLPAASTDVTVNPMEDTQLVAVITAAVTAANADLGGSDQLVVRSIRKAKR